VRVDAVAAGDKFDIPLGVCSDIKINYKPTNKFHHQVPINTGGIGAFPNHFQFPFCRLVC
jgi:hypothetical protein